MDKVIRKNNFYGNRKDTVLRYQKVYQQLTTDRDEVREEFTEFIKRLIDKGFKIIASIEHGDKTQNVRQTIDDNGQIAESKVD